MGRLSKFLCASAVAMLALSSAGVHAASYPKESSASVVATTGASGGLKVNGADYHIKGIAYSPVPVGETVNNPPHGDYFTPDYAYIWARDLPAIKDAGFNTLRIYSWNNAVDHSAFLDAVAQFGLKAIVTFYVDPVVAAEAGGAVPPFTSTEQDAVIAKYVDCVKLYGDHPAILVWAFGNELNGPWNGLVQKFDTDTSNGAAACNWQTSNSGGPCYNIEGGDAAVGSACFTATDCMYNKFFGWLNKAAVAAKEYTTRPQTSTFADVDYFMTTKPATDRLKRFAPLLKDMDIITVQIYRGATFGNYFTDYRAQTDKPLLIGEYGADAYNDPCGWSEVSGNTVVCPNYYGQSGAKGGSDATSGFVGCSDGGECAKPGVTAQTDFDKKLTDEMITQGQVVGGILMEWHDENWKNVGTQARCDTPCVVPNGPPTDSSAAAIQACYDKSTGDYSSTGGAAKCGYKAHITCSNYNALYPDLCGYALSSAPDGYVNEAWFGVNAATDCGPTYVDQDTAHRLTALTPRPVLLSVSGKSSLAPAKSCADMANCYNCVKNAWGTIENARAHIAPGIAKGDCDSACGFTFATTSGSGSGSGNTNGGTTDNNTGTTTGGSNGGTNNGGTNNGGTNNGGATLDGNSAGVVRASIALVASLAAAAMLF